MTTTHKTSKFFENYAADFDAIYGNNSFPNNIINLVFRKSMRIRYLKALQECSPIANRSVLDVGCGPGHYSTALAEAGADFVCGIDFAKSMIDMAQERAEKLGVAEKCRFICADFNEFQFEKSFDYSIVMGFMDYIKDSEFLIKKVLDVTNSKAVFSFPVDHGFLAWQRKLRYKKKCNLYLYNTEQIETLFAKATDQKPKIDKIGRDFFVTLTFGQAS